MRLLVILYAGAWEDFVTRLGGLLRGAEAGLLDLALALAVVLLGWAAAALVERAVRALLRAAHFNDGVRGLLGPASGLHEPARVASWSVYWIVLGGAILLALETAGVGLAVSVFGLLGSVLPRIIASAVLFLAGALIALAFGGLTHRFFEGAGAHGARLRGQLVTGIVTGFAVLVALEQLGFAAQFVMALGLVALGSVGLALGLAFGLGCRDLARDFIVEYLRSLDEGGPKRPS